MFRRLAPSPRKQRASKSLHVQFLTYFTPLASGLLFPTRSRVFRCCALSPQSPHALLDRYALPS